MNPHMDNHVHAAKACAAPFPSDPHASIDAMTVVLNAWYRSQLAIIERALGDGWPDRRQWAERLLRREAELRLADMGWKLS